MKTAMQELIDKIEHAILYNVEGGLVQEYTWTELSNDMYALLEKEKEQIKDAFVECWKTNMPDGYECKLSAKEYYNQTYNQNK